MHILVVLLWLLRGVGRGGTRHLAERFGVDRGVFLRVAVSEILLGPGAGDLLAGGGEHLVGRLRSFQAGERVRVGGARLGFGATLFGVWRCVLRGTGGREVHWRHKPVLPAFSLSLSLNEHRLKPELNLSVRAIAILLLVTGRGEDGQLDGRALSLGVLHAGGGRLERNGTDLRETAERVLQ